MENALPISEFVKFAFHSFLANSSDLIFFKDMKLRYVGASATFVRMAGCESEEELIGKSDYDIFEGELARRYTEDDRRVLESGVTIIDHVEPLPNVNGRNSYSSTSKYLIPDSAGNIIGLYGVGRDVTAQIELKEEQERREQGRRMFEDILEADVTENQMLRMEGSRWGSALGLTNQSSYSDAITAFARSFIHKDYVKDFQSAFALDRLKSEYEDGREEFSIVSYLGDDGISYKWVEFSARLYVSRVTKTLRLIIVIKDLDDEMRRQEHLRQKAETDALTGIYNRDSVMSRIASCLAASTHVQRHALLFIDLDSFKDVNDKMGHPFGDKVLKSIAGNLKTIFRHDDIVGRVGGDEFLVLLRDISSDQDVEKRAEKVLGLPLVFHMEDGKDICVTSSIGATISCKGKTLEQLYHEADLAMYRAKNSGKNTMVFYQPE